MYSDNTNNLGDEARREREKSQRRREDQRQRKAEDDQRREQIRAGVEREGQRQRAYSKLNQRIAQTSSVLVGYYQASDREQVADQQLRKHEDRFPEFLDRPRQSLRLMLGGLLPICGLLLNFVLIAAPVEYLASQTFDENDWRAQAAKYIIPIVLQLFQLGVGAMRHYALENDEEVWLWNLVGITFVVFSPIVVIATNFAREEALSPANLLLTGAVLTLSVAAESITIFAEAFIIEALSFYGFQARRGNLQLQILQATSQRMSVGRKVQSSFDPYLQILEQYNTRNQNTPINPGPFTEWFRIGVNSAYGYQIIPAPPYPGLPDENPIPGPPFTPRRPRTSQNSTISAQAVPEPNLMQAPDRQARAANPASPQPSEVDDPEGDEAENEYRRRIQEEQIRRAEQSIRA